MRRRWIACAVLFLLSLTSCFSHAGAASLEGVTFEISEISVVLRLRFSEKVSYRLWTTKTPAKVIIDAPQVTVPEYMSTLGVDDVALREIRVSSYKDAARIVMDFRYQVPEPEESWDGDGVLRIEVPKTFDHSFEVRLADGVKFSQSRRGTTAGPLIINYLTVDPTKEAMIVPYAASDGLEPVSSMAGRLGAVAAVNGSYFGASGESLGLIITEGKLVNSPYRGRTAFGVGERGFYMEQVDYIGEVEVGNRLIPISGVNRLRLADELILFTPQYGSTTRTNSFGKELIIQDGVVVEVRTTGNSPIPENGFVVSGHGQAKESLAGIEPGTPLSAWWRMEPDWLGMGIRYAIGGGPRIVKDGQVYISDEGFRNDVIKGRAPRTALGITHDGKIILAAVNGRKADITIGMTLEELARLMIELGAENAMNLDGGGSTTMVVRNRVLNLPSDGRERPVGSALLVFSDGKVFRDDREF